VQHRLGLAAICLLSATLAVRAAGEVWSAPGDGGAKSGPADGTSTSGPAPGGPPSGAQAQPGQPSGYVGSDTCLACHSDKADSLKGTPHAQAKNPRTPEATHGCESCHGPGQAHVDDDAKGHIRKFGQIAPAEINETCLACHNRGEHAGWEGSTHDRRKLSCSTCHSVHSPKSPTRQLVKATETEVCVTCHRLQVAKTERAVAHMPVREGKLSCSSCHNPHGSISNVKQLRVGSSINETCMSCRLSAA